MQILGHSADTALLTLLLGFCAIACLFSGVWGLRGRSVWMPDPGPLDGALVQFPEGTTATGRYARLAGAALLLVGIVFAGLAVHVWRANTL
jgi:hypothetical protein